MAVNVQSVRVLYPVVGSEACRMSLRDWFAGQALAGMLAHGDAAHLTYLELASDAYDHADALIEERGKQEE